MKSPLRSPSRHLLATLSLMALGSLPFACRGESATSISGGDGDGDGDSGGDSGGGEISDTPHALEDADNLFDATTIPVFAVTVPQDRWDFMNADPSLEQYEPGELAFNGEAIGPVGIRYKGSVGSLTGCLEDDGALAEDCDKLSFKLKFSEYDKNQRFFGMKRLNFHGMARDKSKLHDKISYKVYRDAGIIAPRSTWARLEVNGESLGLFALVEQIDGRFTDNRCPTTEMATSTRKNGPTAPNPKATSKS